MINAKPLTDGSTLLNRCRIEWTDQRNIHDVTTVNVAKVTLWYDEEFAQEQIEKGQTRYLYFAYIEDGVLYITRLNIELMNEYLANGRKGKEPLETIYFVSKSFSIMIDQ